MYKLARTVTLWSATELAPASTAAVSGNHIWFLTTNALSANVTLPPANSIHKVKLDGNFDRAILEAAFKITAVGTQTLCTACPIRMLSALLYKTDTGLAFFDDSLISQLQGSAVSPADCASGGAALVIGSMAAASAYALPQIVANNAMWNDVALSVPVIGVSGGRTPAVNDVTRFNTIIAQRVAGAQSANAQASVAVDPDISGVAALHLGLKFIPTWTNGAGAALSIAGLIAVHLFRKAERTIG